MDGAVPQFPPRYSLLRCRQGMGMSSLSNTKCEEQTMKRWRAKKINRKRNNVMQEGNKESDLPHWRNPGKWWRWWLALAPVPGGCLACGRRLLRWTPVCSEPPGSHPTVSHQIPLGHTAKHRERTKKIILKWLTISFWTRKNTWEQGRIKLFGAPRQWKHFRPLFQAVFLSGWWGEYSPPPRQSNTTPPSPKTEITNILFYILNFASIIKFKM